MDQLNYLTSQLLLLESSLIRKKKQIANILYQRELTIYRQQKIIETLRQSLIDHGIEMAIEGNTDFDSLNDSDSAVVLEDIDSDCNSSIIMKRKSGNNDVTIVRSISDAIQMPRRTNCYLRRPDILETVYSVEEDPEQQQADQQQSPNSQQPNTDVAEKRDKFKKSSDKRISDYIDDPGNLHSQVAHTQSIWEKITSYHLSTSTPKHPNNRNLNDDDQYDDLIPKATNQVKNFNRVMSNHRNVTKVKDVKYKRINKAKSKSLEELRGKLRNWVDRGSSSSYNLQAHQLECKNEIVAQTFA